MLSDIIKIRKRDILLNDDEFLDDENHRTRDVSSAVGRAAYLARTEYHHGADGKDHWWLSHRPIRGNMDGRIILHGWCGTTDNVAVYAHGKVKVVGQSRTFIHLEKLDDYTEISEGN